MDRRDQSRFRDGGVVENGGESFNIKVVRKVRLPHYSYMVDFVLSHPALIGNAPHESDQGRPEKDCAP